MKNIKIGTCLAMRSMKLHLMYIFPIHLAPTIGLRKIEPYLKFNPREVTTNGVTLLSIPTMLKMVTMEDPEKRVKY